VPPGCLKIAIWGLALGSLFFILLFSFAFLYWVLGEYFPWLVSIGSLKRLQVVPGEIQPTSSSAWGGTSGDVGTHRSFGKGKAEDDLELSEVSVVHLPPVHKAR